VTEVAESDDLPLVKPAHLRRADELCARKLACERAQRRDSFRNRAGDARFAVSNRIEEDARLAHTAMRSPRRSDFVLPRDLRPEQQRLYDAAAAGYITLFGDEPARAIPPDVLDPFGTELPEAGVRLAASIGIALERSDGHPELRILKIGAPRSGRPLVDDVDVQVAALRTVPWLRDGTLRLVAADLLELRREPPIELDLAPTRRAATKFLVERNARIESRVARPKPVAGPDCSLCGFVAGCTAHTAP
jgi:hypothetical protein